MRRKDVDAGEGIARITQQEIAEWLPRKEPIEGEHAARVNGFGEVIPMPPDGDARPQTMRANGVVQTVLAFERLHAPCPGAGNVLARHARRRMRSR